jgi:hypothetical protein
MVAAAAAVVAATAAVVAIVAVAAVVVAEAMVAEAVIAAVVAAVAAVIASRAGKFHPKLSGDFLKLKRPQLWVYALVRGAYTFSTQALALSYCATFKMISFFKRGLDPALER